jgi:hypothetical protein
MWLADEKNADEFHFNHLPLLSFSCLFDFYQTENTHQIIIIFIINKTSREKA